MITTEWRVARPDAGCLRLENGRLGGHFHIWICTLRGMLKRLVPLLLLTACSAAPTQQPSGAGTPRAEGTTAILLQAHNRERAAVRVAPLSWDSGLARGAFDHARRLAGTGQLRHSPNFARPGQGENLWMGTRGGFPVDQMVRSWASEKVHFRPGIFPRVSRTGGWTSVGHYTQMIWPQTARVGCAIASGQRVDVLVCRYAPAGNVVGGRVP